MTAVFIPTKGRVGNQPTYDSLVQTGIETILVCPPEEEDAHRAGGRSAIPCPAKGISATRQWIMDQPYPPSKILMFDDDLRFAERRLDNPGRFMPADLKSTRIMLDRLEAMLDQVPLVGLCNRGGANRVDLKDIPVGMNRRLFDVQCVDTEWFHRERIRYRQPLMEDFDVCLQAHMKGYPTALLTTHTKDNIGGANAGGGCSMYRTMDSQDLAARSLVARWPGFVKPRVVKAKGKGEWSERVDVTVYWQRAVQAGIELRDLLGKEQHPTPDWEGLAPEWELL